MRRSRGAGAPIRGLSARALAGTAAVAALVVGAVVADPPATAEAAETDYASFVNPFVGTESEGNAYPGATAPFGMVQLSPDNANSYQNTSYSTHRGVVWGFSHRHVNSAGCPAAGELLVTPTTGEKPATTRQEIGIKDHSGSGGDGTGSPSPHESAEAGFYDVTLDNDVRAELTATTRVGVHRYTFPATAEANLSFNVGMTLSNAGASEVSWVDERTLEGWVDNGGFCGDDGTKSRLFFSASLDRAPERVGTWNNDSEPQDGSRESTSDGGENGAFATFDTTEDSDVDVHVGVSYVDVEGARANRAAEVDDDASFESVLEQTQRAWNEQLGVAEITASDDAQRVFYTQLYKAMLSPTVGSDVDGRYRGMDQEVHRADDWTYYQTFSLWDTYRTQASLHALLAPERAEDIVRSMYQHRVEGGWLPRWSLGSLETNVMAGDPVSAWVAENFAMGTVPDDIADDLWGHLIENATTSPPDTAVSVGRQSAQEWLENSHIPYYSELEPGLGQEYEEYRHAGSSSMEFAVSDAAIGAAATRLGKPEAEEFLERGRNWQRLWNDDVALSGGYQGMVNAVHPDGGFQSVDEHADVLTSGFHEGTAWQYQWLASQDFDGLHAQMGGEEGFLDRLDHYFAMDELVRAPGQSPEHWASGGSDYYSSIGYNPGNEPTIMNPWLYASAGEPWKTNDVLAANLNRFPNTPGGGVGNDDLGTLASWYVMATLGFQPVVPGSGMLALNTPRVEAATVQLAEGPLTITAAGASESQPSYIAGVSLDGEDVSTTWLDAAEIVAGGTLAFDVTSQRGAEWGTAASDRLPSVAAPLRVDPTVTDLDVDAEGASAARSAAPASQRQDVAAIEFAAAPGQLRDFVESAQGDVTTADVPVTVDLTIGDREVDTSVRLDDGRWIVSADAAHLAAGRHAGELRVDYAGRTASFAPAPFEPFSAEITVAVAAEPGPGPDPDPEPGGSDPSAPGEPAEPGASEPGASGGGEDDVSDLAVTGGAPIGWLWLAAVALIAGGTGLAVVRGRRERTR